MGITMKQIAEMANVSRGTVDRVLNKRPGVKEETREKVQKILDELNYRPNILGQALSQKQREFTIAAITQTGEYYDSICAGIESAKLKFEEYGIKTIVYRISNKNADKNLQFLKSVFEETKFNGLIYSPPNYPQIINAINDFSEKHIPVITLGSDLVTSKRLCYVGQDAYRSGRIAAELMAKLLNGRGNVIITTLDLFWTGLDDRVKGFCDKLKEEYPNILISDIHTELPDIDISIDKILSYLEKYKNIDGIFTNIDYYGLLYDALPLVKFNTKPKVISFDTLGYIQRALKNNIIDFTISQDPYLQGFTSVELMAEYLLFGKIPDKKFNYIPNTIYTKESLFVNIE